MHIVAHHMAMGSLYMDQSYRVTPLTREEAMEKMLRNSEKAILEHQKTSAVYASVIDAIPSREVLEKEATNELVLECSMSHHIGMRDNMEDAHFILNFERGVLMGVFDGHGGKEVAEYASQEFSKRFPDMLDSQQGNAFRAFELLIHQIHEEISKWPLWNKIGTTVVVSFIDKKTHQIITASLGDSEANLYRNNTSIPLTPVRDWSSKKDSKRLEIGMEMEEGQIAEDIAAGFKSKHLRWNGLNVSRAIGDLAHTGTREKPGVVHKPKITINKVREGDILVLACDGLKDFVPENEIVDIVGNAWSVNLARDLVNHTINERKGRDNVTVIVAKIAYDRKGEESVTKRGKKA